MQQQRQYPPNQRPLAPMHLEGTCYHYQRYYMPCGGSPPVFCPPSWCCHPGGCGASYGCCPYPAVCQGHQGQHPGYFMMGSNVEQSMAPMFAPSYPPYPAVGMQTAPQPFNQPVKEEELDSAGRSSRSDCCTRSEDPAHDRQGTNPGYGNYDHDSSDGEEETSDRLENVEVSSCSVETRKGKKNQDFELEHQRCSDRHPKDLTKCQQKSSLQRQRFRMKQWSNANDDFYSSKKRKAPSDGAGRTRSLPGGHPCQISLLMTGVYSNAHGPAFTALTATNPSGGMGSSADISISAIQEFPRRADILRRYRDKRTRRSFRKHIRYQARKANADARPRVRGRFIKMDPISETLQTRKHSSLSKSLSGSKDEECAQMSNAHSRCRDVALMDEVSKGSLPSPLEIAS